MTVNQSARVTLEQGNPPNPYTYHVVVQDNSPNLYSYNAVIQLHIDGVLLQYPAPVCRSNHQQ